MSGRVCSVKSNASSQAHATNEKQGQAQTLNQTAETHRLTGNFIGGLLQCKQSVGDEDDVYEQEADRVAEKVVAMASPPDNRPQVSSMASPHSASVQRKCDACNADALLQDDLLLQRKATINKTPLLSNRLQNSVQSIRGQGRPLNTSERNFFEPRFKQDFSQVRIQTNETGANIAAALKAKAFTVGNDVVFGRGYYDPYSTTGKKLLAHELTHTIQQGGNRLRSKPIIQRAPEDDGDCGKAFEFQYIGTINDEPESKHRGVPRKYYRATPSPSTKGTVYKSIETNTQVFAGKVSRVNALWRSVCVKPDTEDHQIMWVLDEYIDKPEPKSPVAVTPSVPAKPVGGSDSAQFLKAGWRDVKDLGIAYQAGKSAGDVGGVNLRETPGGKLIRRLPQHTKMFIISEHVKQEAYAVTTLDGGGEFGYVYSKLVARHLPDPDADIYKIKPGDTPIDIAGKHYAKKGFNIKGKDSRYVVNGLVWVNHHSKHNFPGDPGIKKASDLNEPWWTAKATADVYIWLPGKDYLNAIYDKVADAGGGTGSLTMDLWRTIKKVGEYAAYGLAFVGGLVHGFVKSIYDALAGLVEMAVDVLVSIFTGNVVSDAKELWAALSSITWKDIKAALGAFADKWEKKLNSDSPWEAGHAHGFLTGYIMAEAAQLLITGGQIAYLKAAIWGSRLGKFIKGTRAFQTFVKAVEKTSKTAGTGKKLLGKAATALRKTKPFKAIAVAREWIGATLRLSAETVKNLSLDGINKLRELSDDALDKLRRFSQPIKHTILGCASPCKVNLDDIKHYLASIAGKASSAKKLTTKADVLAAIPNVFDKSVIADKLKRHKALMEAITRAEITADDLAVMAKFHTPGDAANAAQAYRTFVRTLTSLVPAKVGGDVTKFNEIAAALVSVQTRMGSALKGSMFESFVKLHAGRFRNFNFSRATFSKVMHKVLAKSRTSDAFVDSAGVLWDFKHTVGKVPKDQVDDYFKIMTMKLKSTEGKVTKGVNYLFPDIDVARLNQDLLKKGFGVYYIKPPDIVTKFVP